MKTGKKKTIKYISIALILVIVCVLFFLVYKTLFGGSSSNRLSEVNNYKLTKEEIKDVETVFKDLDSLDKVKVYTNVKILKIFVTLKEDVSFSKMKELSNNALEKISKDNLSYYDVEIFIESKNSDSEVYPKIGYKHKSQSGFVW